MTNITFINNSAAYGPDIASYPIIIKNTDSLSDEITIDNVGSGIEETVNLNLALYDHDGQITNLENSAQVVIKPVNSNSSVLGTTSQIAFEGKVSFDTLTFISEPGSSGIAYSLGSDAIDFDVIRKQYGNDYTLKDITVNFRWCKPGEAQNGNTCFECSAGSYSFLWNSTQCLN